MGRGGGLIFFGGAYYRYFTVFNGRMAARMLSEEWHVLA